ncbi:tyrosine-type recombinase/integrase [Nocardiopsis dassonvillei]|uniref:tyrosine-type recombinase/integrase n=1 Tax=Nocardiopsis dassonvillei TaxID=2014 RepID=UPI00157D5BDA|nr:tyrosine-type recombinase/integrase [Nocardiopsis dassonvillei]
MGNSEPKAKKPKGQAGQGTVYWDEAKGCFRGEISLGYTPSGKRRRPKVYGRTNTEVREKLRDLVKEAKSGVKSSATYTVADAVNDFLKRGLKGRSQATVDKCRNLANKHLIPELGRAKLKDLTADDVDDWLDSKAEELATRSLRELHAVLRRAVHFAQRRDKVLRNVAELVTTPEGKEGRPSKALTLSQARAVLAAAQGTRLFAYVVLSLMVGVRTEEARALRWEHVHLSPPGGVPPHVEVWRSVREHGDTKTRKSRRTLALPAPVVDALRAHQAAQEDDRKVVGEAWQDNRLVFATTVGTELDAANVRRGFRAIVKASGIGGVWTPRELRHSFVSLMSEKGVPLEAIARLVGHSSTSTTETVYRKELRPVITEGAEVMGDLFA